MAIHSLQVCSPSPLSPPVMVRIPSADLTTLLASGGTFYLEVTSGGFEGHRFDIASASGSTITLTNDSDLYSAHAPDNTLTGPPPAGLVGSEFVVRRHWALGENFPVDSFGGTDDRNTADQVQMFTSGTWTIFWLYDDGVAAPYWVAMGSGAVDQGASVLAPGRGMFFNNRTAPGSILAYGEVRENDFIRPLESGSNLVGGGYPIDQSATGTGSRMMDAGDFTGTRDFKTADSFFFWKTDTVIGEKGYDTYYLLDNTPKVPLVQRWVKVGDASLLARDSELLLLGNRSVFLRSATGLETYTIPSPWAP